MKPIGNASKIAVPLSGPEDHRFLYFSEMLKRPVCIGKIKDRIGRLTDLAFSLREPYPEAAGIYIEHGWGKPTEFVPWTKVLRIEDDAIFVQPPENATTYPPFTDQPGWILVDRHLMGRTILDMDGRRIEVVNDAHLLEVEVEDPEIGGLDRGAGRRLGQHLAEGIAEEARAPELQSRLPGAAARRWPPRPSGPSPASWGSTSPPWPPRGRDCVELRIIP